MAILASTLANIHAAKGRRFAPADFLPRFWRAAEPENLAAKVRAVMARLGAR